MRPLEILALSLIVGSFGLFVVFLVFECLLCKYKRKPEHKSSITSALLLEEDEVNFNTQTIHHVV